MSTPNITVSEDRNALILRLPDSPVRRFVAEPSQGATHCSSCPLYGLLSTFMDCVPLCTAIYRPDRRHAAWKEVSSCPGN